MSRNLKKTGVIFSLLAIMLILFSCGEEQSYKSDETVRLLQRDAYYYEGIFYDGSDLDGYTIKMAVKADEFVIAFYDASGMELGRGLKVDGKGYYVDTAAKEYARDPYYDNVTFSYDNMKFLESGTDKIQQLNAVTTEALFYETFEATRGSEKGTVQFLYKDDQLYAMVEEFSDARGSAVSEVVVINKISSETPTEWFGIPEDYNELK